MHLFHKWTKWGEIVEEEWTKTYNANIASLKTERDFIRQVQYRHCEICGKIDVHYLSGF